MSAKPTAGPWSVDTRHHVHAIICNPTRPNECPEVVFVETRGHPTDGSITARMRTDEELKANAQLIAAAPWLELLSRCFLAGWSLERSMLYDEECVEGYRLSNDRREFSWVGDIIDVDERTFAEVQAVLGN
jgi:hypothetical protein